MLIDDIDVEMCQELRVREWFGCGMITVKSNCTVDREFLMLASILEKPERLKLAIDDGAYRTTDHETLIPSSLVTIRRLILPYPLYAWPGDKTSRNKALQKSRRKNDGTDE